VLMHELEIFTEKSIQLVLTLEKLGIIKKEDGATKLYSSFVKYCNRLDKLSQIKQRIRNVNPN